MIILKLIIPALIAFSFVSCIEISMMTGGGGKSPGGGGAACLPWMPPSACQSGGGSGGGPALGPVGGTLKAIHGDALGGVYEVVDRRNETWYLPVPPVEIGNPAPAVNDDVVITFGGGGQLNKDTN